MFSINFTDPTEKMEFEQLEYLLTNYDVGNNLMQPKEIPYFAFDFTVLASSTVWLQVLNFNENTNTFSFVDFIQLDNTKLKSNYFEGYSTVSDNLGICRIVFKNASEDVYKISSSLLKFTTETITPTNMDVVNGWIPFSVTNVSRISDSQIKILGQDVESWAGVGLKINDIISHFVKEAVYDSTDTLLTLTGAGAVPLTITSLKYKYDSIVQSRSYWWGTLNVATPEPSILGLDINANELIWTNTSATIVYAANRNLDEGSNPNNGTQNFTIGGSDLISSDILVATGYADCGILLQNNLVAFHDEVKFAAIIGTGSGDVGRGEIEIIAFI
jgi:hypothetical protein